MSNSLQPPERHTSWWTAPGSREEFDKRAAEQVPRMAASQEGHHLRILMTDVGKLPQVPRATDESDIECAARR